jgi:hypothetical protein
MKYFIEAMENAETAEEREARLLMEAQLFAAAEEEARLERERNPRTGDAVSDKGIFLGVWEPWDRKDTPIGRKYRVYAAPEDLKDSNGTVHREYRQTVEEVAGLTNWHGHDGEPFVTDTALFWALKEDRYEGGWIIPPREIMEGDRFIISKKGNVFWTPNLRDNQNAGDLDGTFQNTGKFYWSCTESYLGKWCTNFAFDKNIEAGGWDDWVHPDQSEVFKEDERAFCCRPCRLEEVKPSGAAPQ